MISVDDDHESKTVNVEKTQEVTDAVDFSNCFVQHSQNLFSGKYASEQSPVSVEEFEPLLFIYNMVSVICMTCIIHVSITNYSLIVCSCKYLLECI